MNRHQRTALKWWARVFAVLYGLTWAASLFVGLAFGYFATH